MKTDWSKLTFYPHHADGNPRRYAQRQAMLARLNRAESLFNRLKAGRKLATPGAARTRVRDKDSVDALISLALLSMTALTVVDQRQQAGGDSAPPPRAPMPSKRQAQRDIVPAALAAGSADAPVVRRRGHLSLISGGAG